ncbi:MAG: peptide chain release factor N(5)-glutamine methyltransferase [Pseudomonadota bacterium]
MTTVLACLKNAQTRLIQALDLRTSDARLEAQLFLAQILGVNRAWLLAHDDDELTASQVTQFEATLNRRLKGEPVAYIFGEKEFYDLRFKVSPAVLIPRPETELLVELALARLPLNTPCRVLDLGTGSGAIALTLAKLRPLAEVVAVDVSADALHVAADNAAHLGVPNVRFIQSDWFSQLGTVGKFDAIVSNPPYIAVHDRHLSQGDLRFEPLHALASGQSGYDALDLIIQHAPDLLCSAGWLGLEHGYDQGAYVRAALSQAGFQAIMTQRDLAGVERATSGTVG